MANTKFILDGCDISFVAEAPEDITLKELLAQTDRIKPDWCACGIRSWVPEDYSKTEILITKDSVELVDDNVNATIMENGEWIKWKH